MIAIGIGARAVASEEDIMTAVISAMKIHDLRQEKIDTLSAPDRDDIKAAIATVGLKLSKPVIHFSISELKAFSHLCLTQSNASIKHTGIASISEAAALCSVGEGATLLAPRNAFTNVTVAVASNQTTHQQTER